MIPRLTSILQRVLPNYCLLCKNPSGSKLALCRPCIALLPWHTEPCCDCCSIPLPTAALCGRCQRNPPAFTQVVAPLLYQPPIDQFVYKLKFSHKLIYAHLLGHLMVHNLIDKKRPLPQALIPVPLHPKRLQTRGFNQAGELAKILARELNLKCLHFSLSRSKPTQPQAQLKAKARARNVKSAFKLEQSINYSSIAVIDDVITTTATVREVCLTLQQAGVKQIEVWAAARARR